MSLITETPQTQHVRCEPVPHGRRYLIKALTPPGVKLGREPWAGRSQAGVVKGAGEDTTEDTQARDEERAGGPGTSALIAAGA